MSGINSYIKTHFTSMRPRSAIVQSHPYPITSLETLKLSWLPLESEYEQVLVQTQQGTVAEEVSVTLESLSVNLASSVVVLDNQPYSSETVHVGVGNVTVDLITPIIESTQPEVSENLDVALSSIAVLLDEVVLESTQPEITETVNVSLSTISVVKT